MRFLAGILIQQVLRFVVAMASRPPRSARADRSARPSPESSQRSPKKPKTTIDPKNIVEGRFEDIPEK